MTGSEIGRPTGSATLIHGNTISVLCVLMSLCPLVACAEEPPRTIDDAARLPAPAERHVDFVQDVQPIFRKWCFECHSQANEEGGLNLGIKLRALAGGASGPVIIAGNSAQSRLVHMIAGIRKSEVMPPDGEPLSGNDVGLIRAWIDQGAEWPSNADVLDVRMQQAKTHWAFQPLKSVQPPAVHDDLWIRSPLDRFILSGLEAEGLQPSLQVPARTLVRRLFFDIIGLPPTLDDIDEFCQAAARDFPLAVQSLVERLLKSPHYGERWGRHWLDIARYADSDGQESDADRPQAYLYRDFVIRALNDDMPFDQFVRWQLAGNEYEPENPLAVAATGFLIAGPYADLGDNLMEEERTRARYDELDDMIATIGTGMLGLTLGCARCHNHKYDAIPARDYYGILKALQSGRRAEVTVRDNKEKIFSYKDGGADPKPAWLLRRGDFTDHSQPVELGFVSLMTRDRVPNDYLKQVRENASASNNTTFQRRALAEWMTDVDRGAGALVARVIVNRIWQHHFGDALVRTVGDFGVRSEPPTHPELLEWLANDLVQNGWKLKRLHKLILTSSTYQQSGKASNRIVESTPSRKSDPDNRLRGRMRPQRLQAEILRDAMLAVSGTLNEQVYGPAFKPPIHAEAMLARNVKDAYPGKVDDSAAVRRRSVYMFHKRVIPYPLMQAFDKPDALQTCNRRDPTTVAPQALAMLNDPFVRIVSLDFAQRLLKEAGNDSDRWIDQGYLLAFGRRPLESEQTAAREFVEQQIKERTARLPQASIDEIRRLALADLCQTWFSLNEFLYID